MTIQIIPKQLHAVGSEIANEEMTIAADRNYFELTTMLDRLHRRYLDVVRLELEAMGIRDVNPSQALLLTMLNDGDVPLRDILQRGGYTASTAAYMIKKLVENGYIEQARAAHDRRTIRLRLTRAGKRVAEHLAALNSRHAGTAGGLERMEDEIVDTTATLRRLDRIWTDFLTFGQTSMPN
ncbi:MAG: winged helix DNA-binding protein [Proteobacteria bacterium]|nr:winged helix DNA-binding protein [Pseudomonadota bacterium]